MKKKFWSKAMALLMTLCMVISMCPLTAFAAEEDLPSSSGAERQDITQTGVDFTTPPTEETSYKAGEGTITFTPASENAAGVIALNNVTLTGPGVKLSTKPAIKLPAQGEYVIKLHGQNTVTQFNTVFSCASGSGNLKVTFSGDGQLNVSECNFFINSLRELVFDGANITSNTEYSSIVSLSIAITNNSVIKLYVQDKETEDYSNIAAGDVVISDSEVALDTNSDCGIYDWRGPNGIKIVKSTVNIAAGSNGYGGLVSNDVGDIVIEDSNVTISRAARGIWANNNSVKVLGNSVLEITADAHGIRLDHGTVKFTGTSKTTINSKSNGLRVKNAPTITDTASVEINANSHICEAQNSEGEIVYAVSPDFSGYNEFGYTAVSNTEATANNASAWDESTGLDGYKYFKVSPTPPRNVTFELGYDGIAPADQILKTGSKVTQPTNPTREGYNFAGWYGDADCKTAWNFGTDTVTKDMTLYAKWIPEATAVYTASGTVTGNTGEDMSGAIVKLMQGNSVIAAVTTGTDGKFTFANLPAGHYNITVEKGERGVTASISLTADTTDITLKLPAGNIKTEVNVDENTPNTYVSGLDALAEDSKYAPNDNENVRIVLNVAGKEESEIQADVNKIKALSGNETLSYLDMNIKRYVNEADPENIG